MIARSKWGIGQSFSATCAFGLVLFLFMLLKVPSVPLYKEGDVSLARVCAPVPFSITWDVHSLFERGDKVPKTFGRVYQIQGEIFNDYDETEHDVLWLSVAKKFFQTVRFVDSPTQECLKFLQGDYIAQDLELLFLSPSIPEDRDSFIELCIHCLDKFLRHERCPACYRYRLLCAFNGANLHLVLDRETTNNLHAFFLNAQKQEEFPKEGIIVDKYQKITARDEKILQQLHNKIISSKQWFVYRQDLLFVFVTTVFMLFLGYRCLLLFGRDLLSSSRRFLLYILVCMVSLIGVKIVEVVCCLALPCWGHVFEYPVLVPFTGITLGYLLNGPVAAASCALFSIVYTCTSEWGDCCFFSINLLSTWYILFSSRKSKRLSSVIWQTLNLSWFALCILMVYRLFNGEVTSKIIITDVISCFIGCLLTALSVILTVFVLEAWLGENTHHCLLNYLDFEQPLLKRLFKEAPGTYQHSVLVGSLAEAAAAAIDADSLLCRVAAQYHDIGKLCNPGFFTENRLSKGDSAVTLSAIESAQMIIRHVSYGVELARKEGLPGAFIDIIEEHHGTTLMSSVYHRHIQENPDFDPADEKIFRYPGRTPRTKEATIIMIADSVEAASRATQDFSEAHLRSLVNRIISGKMLDGQFSHSPLSLDELAIVAETMVHTLYSALHRRIRYPEVSLPLKSKLCNIYES